MSALQPPAYKSVGPQPLIRQFIISPFFNRTADVADEMLTADIANPVTDENNLEIKKGERIFSLHLYVQRTIGIMNVETSSIASQVIPQALSEKGHTILAKTKDRSESWKAYIFYFHGGKEEKLDDSQRRIIEVVKKAILDNKYAFKMMKIKKADESTPEEINEFGRKEFGEKWSPEFGRELWALDLSPMGKMNM